MTKSLNIPEAVPMPVALLALALLLAVAAALWGRHEGDIL